MILKWIFSVKQFKTISFLIILSLVLNFFITGLVRNDVYAASKTPYLVCEELGILQGDGEGVTIEYLSKDTIRLQGAIMYLRLKGLEEEALSYTGITNFSDANEVSWSGGRAILSYLYNHPELGWIGDEKGYFNPNAVMSTEALYKVLLVSLGYEQGVDFEWSEVENFAGNHGLDAGVYYDKVNNDLFAKVIVEALETTMKNGELFAQHLVDISLIELGQAVELGIINFPANEYYDIIFTTSDSDGVINADGVSYTTVTATIVRKADGAKMGIYGMMTFYLTEGELDKSEAVILDGEATVWVTSQMSYSAVISQLSAQVTDAGNYTEFQGLAGETSITFDPNEEIEDVNYSKVSIESVYTNACDRFTVMYSGQISAQAYKAVLMQKDNRPDWETTVLAGTNAGMFLDGYRFYIKDIIQVSSSELEFILDTDYEGSLNEYVDEISSSWLPQVRKNYLKDNVSHMLSVPTDVGQLVTSTGITAFTITDTSSPTFLSATSTSDRTLVLYFSEALCEETVEMDSRGAGNVNNSTIFDFSLNGTKDVFRIDGHNLYLTESSLGATPDEIAFALKNNVILVNELYVGGYDEVAGVDHRDEVVIILDPAVSLTVGQHIIKAANITDWAGKSDPINRLMPAENYFYIFNQY